MDDLQIRPATAEDAERLAEVYRSAYRENRELGFPAKAGSATAEQVADWIRDHRVYVAEVEGEIVGGVRLEVAERPDSAEPLESTEQSESAERTESPKGADPDCVNLSRFAVHENWKGEGVGSRLLDRVEDEIREWGYDAVWLSTPEEHPYLPDFYRRRGYEKTGPYPLEYRDYDEIVMEKRLG